METNYLNHKTVIRFILFILGIFFMALGVSLSVKAGLGVSPVSCVPYIYSLAFTPTIGELTVLLNAFFMVMQILILRKRYHLIQLLQLLVAMTFGYFIDFTMAQLSQLTYHNYLEQFILCITACFVLAFGIFLLVKTQFTYMPLDGFVVVVAKVLKKEFGKIKVLMDSSLVIFAIISSFVLLKHLDGIREGSVIAALLVGTLVRFYAMNTRMVHQWIVKKRLAHQDSQS